MWERRTSMFFVLDTNLWYLLMYVSIYWWNRRYVFWKKEIFRFTTCVSPFKRCTCSGDCYFAVRWLRIRSTKAWFIRSRSGDGTGKSLSEALIVASTNPQYACSLNYEFSTRKLQVQYMLCKKIVFLFLFWHSEQFMNTTCTGNSYVYI